jgi:hypothetical protein
MSEFKPLDPTACGLFLVAVVSFPLAIANLIDGQIGPSSDFFTIIGALILVVALLAYRAESNFGFTVFTLVGAAVLLTGLGIGPWEDIAFTLTFLLAIIWSLNVKAPKALTIICFTTALVFLTVGLSGIVGGDYWHWLIGIAALLNFIFNIYLSFALAMDGKIKVF